MRLGTPKVFNRISHLVGQALNAGVGPRFNQLVKPRDRCSGSTACRFPDASERRAAAFGADSIHRLWCDVAQWAFIEHATLDLAGSFLANSRNTLLNNRTDLTRNGRWVGQVRQEFACGVKALGRWISRRFWPHAGLCHLRLDPVTAHDRLFSAVPERTHEQGGNVNRCTCKVIRQLRHALGHVYVGLACVQLLTDRALLAIHASAWACLGRIVLIERSLVGGQSFDLLRREPFSAGR